MKRALTACLFLVIVLFAFAGLNPQKMTAQPPQRGFSIQPEYTHLAVGPNEKIKFDVDIVNQGQQAEEIELSLIGPEGWETWLTKWGESFEVRGVLVDAGKKTTLQFRATPPENASEGDYKFILRGTTNDGQLQESVEIMITLKSEAVKPEGGGIKLATDYPSIKNPAGKNFEFDIQIENKVDEERVFDLLASIPAGWDAYCTPRWEREKKISSIKVGGKSSEWIKLVLVPPADVPKGEYPVKFGVRSDGQESTIDLKAIITGTYELKLGTEAEVLGTGETRNIKAIAGREKHFTLYLWNEGTAPISDIDFFASKPADWDVSFEPKNLPSLPPITSSLKPETVDVIIKPKAKAIPGDYMVTITASGKEAREQMELRVTVGTPMTWGWVGIAIVAVVIAALIGIFVRLGRR